MRLIAHVHGNAVVPFPPPTRGDRLVWVHAEVSILDMEDVARAICLASPGLWVSVYGHNTSGTSVLARCEVTQALRRQAADFLSRIDSIRREAAGEVAL